MAYGYQKGYVIEYTKQSKRNSCSKCIYYQSDKSCDKIAAYIPDLGYNYYKYCKHYTKEGEEITEAVPQNQKKSKPIPKGAIPIEQFVIPNLMMANVIRIAIENKKDLYSIVEKCDKLMAQSSGEDNKKKYFEICPQFNTTIIYLSLLSKELDCELVDFFNYNTDDMKTFTYKLLENIHYYDFDDIEEDDDETIITITHGDFFLDIVPMETIEKRSDGYWLYNMPIEITRDNKDKYYSISYGNLLMNGEKTKYITKGGYLWEEKRGKLKELADKAIQYMKD